MERAPAYVSQAGHDPVSRAEALSRAAHRGRIILSRDPDGGERCVACYLCAAVCPVDCIALQATQDENERRYPEFFRINFSRCIFCGLCEDACPTYAIQLTPDFEMSEFNRANLVYEKEDLLIDGPGKYPGYNFWRVSGVQIGGKAKASPKRAAPHRRSQVAAMTGPMEAAFYVAAVVAVLTIIAITRPVAVHALLYLIVSFLALAVVFYAMGAALVRGRLKSSSNKTPAPSSWLFFVRSNDVEPRQRWTGTRKRQWLLRYPRWRARHSIRHSPCRGSSTSIS